MPRVPKARHVQTVTRRLKGERNALVIGKHAVSFQAPSSSFDVVIANT